MLTAAAVGAGLAIAGGVMQSLTRNPLADPYLLGLSSGASLGAVAVLVVGVSLLLPVAAFAGALLALVATLALARSGSTLSPGRTVLAGLAVSQMPPDELRHLLELHGRLLPGDPQLAPRLAGGRTWARRDRRCRGRAGRHGPAAERDAARRVRVRYTSAAALGIDVDRTRWTLMTVVALLTGAMVAVSGAIGFVGLILPHAVSSLTGPAHRRLLPVAALSGAVFLIWADTLARTVFDPRELPVGIVTALIGVPVFAVLLRRGAGSAWT